jgi:hypothetical protein
MRLLRHSGLSLLKVVMILTKIAPSFLFLVFKVRILINLLNQRFAIGMKMVATCLKFWMIYQFLPVMKKDLFVFQFLIK